METEHTALGLDQVVEAAKAHPGALYLITKMGDIPFRVNLIPLTDYINDPEGCKPLGDVMLATGMTPGTAIASHVMETEHDLRHVGEAPVGEGWIIELYVSD